MSPLNVPFPRPRRTFHGVLCYGVAAVLCFVVMALVLRLWQADLKVPFTFHSDALFTGMFVKAMMEDGWIFHSSRIGMPLGSDLYDYPLVESVHFLSLKALSFFTANYAWVLNVYYLAGFLLIALSALFVCRQLGLSYGPSLVTSLLFPFLPYHLSRNEVHLFLSTYYVVPLAVLVALWIFSKDLFWDREGKWKPLTRESLIGLGVCLLCSSSGIYYAFFSCFFFGIAGLGAAVVQRNVRKLFAAGLLAAAVFGGVLVNVLPNHLYRRDHGSNPLVAYRGPGESEIYGLKIVQLLLPSTGHRVGKLARLKDRYNAGAPLVTENDAVSLGLVGGLGFLLLIGRFVFFIGRQGSPLLDQLGALNLAGLLFGTIGGGGTLFAVLVSPQLRAYNRISVFLAFLSLLALSAGIDAWIKRCAGRLYVRFWATVFCGLLIVAGLLDLVSSHPPAYAENKAAYLNQKDFIQTLERALPSGAMVFQLPYVPFPENPPVFRMTDYDHFRAYLLSDRLRWSYGAMKGRPADDWQKQAAGKPLDEFVETLASAGFGGIYIDRFGYADNGARLEKGLAERLRQKPLEDSTRRFLFFSLRPYAQALREARTGSEWERRREEVLNPLVQSWTGGFSGFEGDPSENWRWCSSSGELRLINTLSRPRPVTVAMSFSTGFEQPSRLVVEGPSFKDSLAVSIKRTGYSKTLVLPPGESSIRFSCDAPRLMAPNDPRFLVFSVHNFALRETMRP